LGRVPDGGELEELIVGADPRGPFDDNVRADNAAGTDLHLRADDAEGTHGHVRGELRLRRYQSVRIDHLPVSGATIISSWATSVSPTSAAVEKRQMPFRARSTCAVSTS